MIALQVKPKTSIEIVDDEEFDSAFFRKLEEGDIYLNKEQIEAVRHNTTPLLVSASPGSGKSSVIIAKVVYLIEVLGVAPESILVITYTRKASEELKERLRKMRIIGNVMARTLHSLCYQIFSSNSPEKFKLLVHEQSRVSIMKRVLRELDLLTQYQPEDALTQLSCSRNRLQKLEPEHQLCQVSKLYSKYLADNKLIDFDRLLIMTHNMLYSNPKLLMLIYNRFQYVLVDEMQDITALQLNIIKMVTGDNPITCVGDVKQTIFGFGGADSKLMLRFDEHFKDLKKISLNVNYRNTPTIAGLANHVIKQCKSLPASDIKVTKDRGSKVNITLPKGSEEESEYVINYITERVEAKKNDYGDFCILFRSFNSARSIHEKLILKNIPFIQSGNAEIIYEHDTIKPLIDHLRLSIDPYNLNALLGVIGTMYLNKIHTMQFANDVMRKENMSALDMLLKLPGLKDYQYDLINRRVAAIKELDGLSPLEAIKVIRDSGYDKYYKLGSSLSLQSSVILDFVQDVEESASRFITVEQFLQYIDELLQKANMLKDNNYPHDAVSFISMHSSKGLQFKTVFIVGCIEGVMPHKNAIEPNFLNPTHDLLNNLEEECRLLYVALTRAEEDLIVSIPQHKHDKQTQVSRFISDIC